VLGRPKCSDRTAGTVQPIGGKLLGKMGDVVMTDENDWTKNVRT
jgi:hypothetical protein